ncbi:MAG: hypothetical protein KAG28_04385 [Cocleimonas sp.]|nr:hypothetical protein [Cocleimonas sp.]
MIPILLFIFSGILIGLSIGLLLFKLANQQQLKKTKLKAMAGMYHEILLKQRNKTYRYSEDAETVIKAVSASHILK